MIKIATIILTGILLLLPLELNAQGIEQSEKFYGEVKKVDTGTQIIGEENQLIQTLEVQLDSGEVVIPELIILRSEQSLSYKVGDKVILALRKNVDGQEIYTVTDFQRTIPLAALIVIFIILVVAVGKKKGIYSLIGLCFSFFVIFTFILPQLYTGKDSLFITVIAAIIVIPVTFYLSHGFNRKTSMAIIGTLITLLISGILAEVFVELTKLSGFSSDEAFFLQQRNELINLRDILLSSLIISFLGILDDITISQSAIAFELHNTSERQLSFNELYSKTMNIGKDHIASLVNTLILVYTGAALPLLLLVTSNTTSISEFLNTEILAEEVVRTLVASIGLISAVPITTLITCYYIIKNPEKSKQQTNNNLHSIPHSHKH
jgi:uncharacterized membrane protein